MMPRPLIAALIAVLVSLGAPLACGAAEAVTLRFATLDYPPYTSPTLPGEGALAAVLRAALEPLGYRVTLEFLPYARVYAEVMDGRVDGVVAAWPRELTTMRAAPSTPIFASEVGFFCRRAAPPPIEPLSARSIAITRGYGYPDRLLKSGARLFEVTADPDGLRMVIAGHVDLATVEYAVGAYWLRQGGIKGADTIGPCGPPLDHLPLLIGFTQGRPNSARLQAEFHDRLAALKKSGAFAAIAKTYAVTDADAHAWTAEELRSTELTYSFLTLIR